MIESETFVMIDDSRETNHLLIVSFMMTIYDSSMEIMTLMNEIIGRQSSS